MAVIRLETIGNRLVDDTYYVTSASSCSVNRRFNTSNLSGTSRMRKNGNARAAGVDLTAQRIPRQISWMIVNACIFTTLT